MKKRILCRIISIVMFPFYALAYGISQALKLKDRENMPTFSEWFNVDEIDEIEMV